MNHCLAEILAETNNRQLIKLRSTEHIFYLKYKYQNYNCFLPQTVNDLEIPELSLVHQPNY